ncbi:hypothetical protein CTA2_8796 [Colletotrichum tanaceti]|nr:hypothetical protein CTA2_8796 [Colletotrichum tanaceti]
MHPAPTASPGGGGGDDHDHPPGTDFTSEKRGGRPLPESGMGAGELEVGHAPLSKADEMMMGRSSPAKDAADAADATVAADASDLEVGTNQTDSMRNSKGKRAKWTRFYKRYRLPVHVVVWMLFTA